MEDCLDKIKKYLVLEEDDSNFSGPNGKHRLYRFPNNYGVSTLTGPHVFKYTPCCCDFLAIKFTKETNTNDSWDVDEECKWGEPDFIAATKEDVDRHIDWLLETYCSNDGNILTTNE